MDTTKEHKVTEIYYPLGCKVPYSRPTCRPLECDSPELQTCDSHHYYAWADYTTPPESLAGFQLVTEGKARRGDLVISNETEIKEWAFELIGEPVAIFLGLWRIYRKIPVANHADIACQDTKDAIEAGKAKAETDYPTYILSMDVDGEGRVKGFKSCSSAVPKGAAGKLKPQLQLIPPVLDTETAKALAFGAYHPTKNYGPWNWRDNKVEIMTYLGAMKRHIAKVIEGEDIDPESGAYHLGHVAASCGIVLDAQKHGTLINDRPPKPAKDAV